MKSWGLTEADFADEWAWRRACRAKTSRLARWWHTTLNKVEKASNGVDQPAETSPIPRTTTSALACLHLDLSGISDHHNDNGALVMQLQPLEGEKPAGLRDLVRYRVCRACGYGFIYGIELHTSGGHGMGREIVWKIIGPTGTSNGEPLRSRSWASSNRLVAGVGRSARSSRSAGQPVHAFRMAARGRATDAADHLKSWRACRQGRKPPGPAHDRPNPPPSTSAAARSLGRSLNRR